MPQRTETDEEQVTRLEARADLVSDILHMKIAADILRRRGSIKVANMVGVRIRDWEEQAEQMKGPMRW